MVLFCSVLGGDLLPAGSKEDYPLVQGGAAADRQLNEEREHERDVGRNVGRDGDGEGDVDQPVAKS